jgi:patatin-like phospholipase/acyl hydrolase
MAAIQTLGGSAEYLIDGGLFAADPTLCAVVEARKSVFEQCANPSFPDLYILSIGTGRERKKYDYKKAQNWGIAQWAVPVLNIMMSASSEVGSYQVRELFRVAGHEESYVRLEPELNKAKQELDDVSDENIKNLKDAGLYYISQNVETLDKIVNELKIENEN